MASHRFVVSPPGNGIDCHRTWESLYLGSIPIVKASACMKAFAKVGLMVVPDISMISKRELREYFEESRRVDDLRVLFFSYWKSLISSVIAKKLPGRGA
jgi:hypothetical protein